MTAMLTGRLTEDADPAHSHQLLVPEVRLQRSHVMRGSARIPARAGRAGWLGADALVDRACRRCAAPSPGLPSRRASAAGAFQGACFLQGRADAAGDGRRPGVVVACSNSSWTSAPARGPKRWPGSSRPLSTFWVSP